jgi:uncharacterized Zn finger protein
VIRIGKGPWARLFATAVMPDEGSSVAEHGRRLLRGAAVGELKVEVGKLSAEVDGDQVTIAAEPVPPRIWAALALSARNTPQLEAAVQGRTQSVHLEHLMTMDWERPLVPRTRELTVRCTCGHRRCEHVAAAAYAFAEEIDRDPGALLRWRGVDAVEAPAPEPEPLEVETVPPEAWEAGLLPKPRPLRPLPVGAVLKRLGPSGLSVGGDDLVDVLERAYAEFAKRPR